jgi:hypothetical protein
VRADRFFAPVAARCAALAGAVLIAAAPVYIYMEPPWRPLIARLAGGLVAGSAILQLRRALADRLELAPPSALDEALRRPVADPAVPARFDDLLQDIKAARRSRRYFDEVLWPRLSALAPDPPAPPPPRRGRGPTLRELDQIVAQIERRA